MEDAYSFSRMRDRISACCLLAFAIFVFVESGAISDGARMFPRMVSGLMGICALVILGRSFVPGADYSTGERGDAIDTPAVEVTGTFSGALRVGVGFVLSVIYCVVVPYVGFTIATAVFMIVSALVFGYRKWLTILVTTAVFVVPTSLLLRYVFFVLLPEPWLGF